MADANLLDVLSKIGKKDALEYAVQLSNLRYMKVWKLLVECMHL